MASNSSTPMRPLPTPLDGGRAAVLERSFTVTAAGLDGDRRTDDGGAWLRLFGPLVRDAGSCQTSCWARSSTCRATRWLSPASGCRHCAPPRAGSGPVPRGGGAGAVRRACGPLDGGAGPAASASFGLVLGDVRPRRRLADGPRRGRGRHATRSAAELRALGGEIVTGDAWTGWRRCPRAGRVVRHDPAGRRGDRRRPSARADPGPLDRFRYGPGVFKVDWALDGPIPWTADGVARAGTVHLGGTLDEVAASGVGVAAGRHPDAPVRAAGPVPARGTRRARRPGKTRPGRTATSRRLGRRHDGPDRGPGRAVRAGLPRPDPGPATRRPAALERYNANYVGGDITGGVATCRQLF